MANKNAELLISDEIDVISKNKMNKIKRAMNKNLFLIVTKYYYDTIASGWKRTEYRANTPYWQKRLKPFLNSTGNTVEFQCGYSRKYPRLKFNIKVIDCSGTPLPLYGFIKTKSCFKIYFK